ncbi:MAG: MFS transporter [Elusimicrobiota bacterium]|jgi:MFS family permease|nr:MFS transporter [Elusimicrobiota bacterium]
MSARGVFFVLFSINLLNYIDRQILFAVFPLLQTDLKLSDTHLGVLGSAFMFIYMLAAPFIGFMADRTPRQIWIAATAFLWSIATMLTGCVRNYWQLLAARGFIGIGEAGFTSVSPSFIAERFPAGARAKALALYGMALPLGSALGYLIGAALGSALGWRHVFWICGLPGIILAVLVFLKVKDNRPAPPKKERPPVSQYLKLLGNKPFLFTCLAQAMATFTLGGLAAWMPTYLHRYFGLSVARAGIIFGLITITAGAAGTLLGGAAADRLLRKTDKAYFTTSLFSFACALPCGIAAFAFGNFAAAAVALWCAVFFIFLQTGPLQAAIVACTDIKIRSMAFALNIFIIHALGDALSPAVIGRLSDAYTLKTAVLLAMLFIVPAGVFTRIAGNFYRPAADKTDK